MKYVGVFALQAASTRDATAKCLYGALFDWIVLQINTTLLSKHGSRPNKVNSLSVHFNGHFPGGPELASTGMSSFWILLELKNPEVVVTTGAIRHAKLQSNRHRQQTNIQFFTGCLSFLSPNQQCQSTEGKNKVN